jgi:hypothetical protein
VLGLGLVLAIVIVKKVVSRATLASGAQAGVTGKR